MGEKEWYFFNLRNRKYPTGVRTNRATSTGYWKTTGKDKEIYNSSTYEPVGMKKTLVFYRGRAPRGEKTNWVMHEYRIQYKSSFRTSKDEWVICRVIQKSAGAKMYPSNQSRVVPPYNLDIVPSIVAPTMMPAENFHFLGRNYVNGTDIMEINQVFRNGMMNMSQPMHPHQLNPAPFALSGLNLNLGGTGAAQTVLRPMIQPQAPGMNRQDMMASSTIMSVGTIEADQGGYGGELGNAGNTANNRYIGMEHCVEMDNYWPSY